MGRGVVRGPGSRPRVRGDCTTIEPFGSMRVGPSPRAGTMTRTATSHRSARDHPGLRGDLVRTTRLELAGQGPSTRTWGPHGCALVGDRQHGATPAHAGTTDPSVARTTGSSGHPGARGDRSRNGPGSNLAFGPSPHTRGPRHRRHLRLVRDRTIPAHAGTTPGTCAAGRWLRDHPRTRGDHSPPPGQLSCRSGNFTHLPKRGASTSSAAPPTTSRAPPGATSTGVVGPSTARTPSA